MSIYFNNITNKHCWLTMCSLWLFIVFSFATPASASIIKYRWLKNPQTALEITFREPITYKTFSLKSPNRLVIDIDGANWPASLAQDQTLPDLVSHIRYHNKTDTLMRLVLDIASNQFTWKDRLIRTADGYKLLITLESQTKQSMTNQLDALPITTTQSLETGSSTQTPSPTLKPKTETLSLVQEQPTKVNNSLDNDFEQIPIPNPKPSPPLKVGRSRAPYKPVIVIDPGHGGKDPGARGRSNTWEKEVTLTYGKLLKTALEKTGKYKVILTRSDDTYVGLAERVDISRENHGDLFIALHADSHHDPQVHGLSVYTLSENASDMEAQRLASRANKEEAISGINVFNEDKAAAGVLIELIQRDTKNSSVRFAELAAAELSKITSLLQRSHRFAGFRVLKSPDVPSVLIEMGYLSNRNEEMLLRTKKYQNKMVGALLKAINQYFVEERLNRADLN